LLAVIPTGTGQERPRFTDDERTVLAHLLLAQFKGAERTRTSVAAFAFGLGTRTDLERLRTEMSLVAPVFGLGEMVLTRHGPRRTGMLRTSSQEFLDLVRRAREDFAELGLALMLAYGTLLGAVREGNFLAHDDDVDLLYAVEASSTIEARPLVADLARRLRERGWLTWENESGNALNFHLIDPGSRLRLDLFPVLTDGNRVHLHMEHMNVRDIPRGLVLPARKSTFLGQDVLVPRDPEGFLAERYGPSWSVPDPYDDWAWPVDEVPKHAGHGQNASTGLEVDPDGMCLDSGPMGIADMVNRSLRRAAGVELVRTDTLEEIKKRGETARENARLARERAKENKAKHDKLYRYAKRQYWDIPPDYHPDMQWIWPKVKDRTMVGHEKVNYFCDAVRYINRAGIEGDIVECGVWRGGAMLACALTLHQLGDHSRDLYLYDTFEGMSEPTERDVHIWHGRTAEHEMENQTNRTAPIWEPGLIEDVRAGFDEADYPEDKLHFVKGKVEDTIPQTAPEKIAILRLDTDWYESTRHELEHLYPRLAPGGILIIDDYGSWQGSRDAADEYLASCDEPVFLVRTGKGRAAVKPGLTSQSGGEQRLAGDSSGSAPE
jgi:hypothetical protein